MNEIAPAAALPAAIDEATADRLVSAWASARTPATRRAYGTAWRAWTAWADDQAVQPLPAVPETVAAYLAARANAGAGMATLRMATAAIGLAHRIADADNPCADSVVREAMKGLSRQAAETGETARQARGLDVEAVAAIRGALNGRIETSIRAARDMALVSTMADAGLRRSEAASLTWADVNREADGSGRLTIRTSKTDQTGEGAVVAITAAAMADLERLAARRGRDPDSAVFGIGPAQIRNRIATLAKAAGLGDGFTGHSGRVGMAQRMTRNGAPAAAVMRQGRWDTTRMVARYTRGETAAEALRYL